MALSTRERRTLDEIARRFHVEEPLLARELSGHGSGMITSEVLPSALFAWPIAALSALLALCCVAAALLQ